MMSAWSRSEGENKKGLVRNASPRERKDTLMISVAFRLIPDQDPSNARPDILEVFCKVLSYRISPPQGALFSLRVSVEFNHASLWWGRFSHC
jgi:hypothetical protein